MPRVSIIIPTYHRPDDLELCLASILTQTRLPEEVLVIDDGDLPGFPQQEQFEAAGVRCIYFKKDKPGLAASRNVGIKLSHGDLIFYLDDDVELFPEYVEEILKVFEGDPDGRIGAVCAKIANHPKIGPLKRLRRLYDVLFLISGFKEGTMLRSGFFVEYGTTGTPIREVRDVDFVSGGASAFRRKVFQTIDFSEYYYRYSSGEDKYVSFKVSQRYRIVYTPFACLNHYESSTMRRDDYLRGRRFIFGKYLIFRDHKNDPRLGSWYAFSYAIFGYMLFRTVVALAKPGEGRWKRVGGNISAIKDLALGRLEDG